MAKRVGVDKWMFCVTLLLVVFGLVMVFSASAVMAKERFGSPYAFLNKQAIWAALGLAAMVVLMRVDYRRYNSSRFVYPVVAVTMLLLLAVFAMHDSHHTHRWFRSGPLSFQPSEIAKPVLVLFLAWFLQDKVMQMEDWRKAILPAAIPCVLFIGLIMAEPDLGTALVCAGTAALMMYLAGLQKRWFALGALAAAPVMYYMLFRVAWRAKRLMVFMNPDADPRGAGFHIQQSLIAIGTGGWRGLGLMEGRQKLFYLPEPHTDFIFANIAEELGLIGALVLIGLFVALGYRGLRTAVLSQDPFARFIAFGVSATVLIQAFFNISVTLALLPTKGITLPFISSGGTSLFIMLCSIGVLLNISREID